MKHKQYLSYSNVIPDKEKVLLTILDKYKLDGTEVSLTSLVPRENLLFRTEKEKQTVIKQLNNIKAKRIHMSYWAEQVDFLEKVNFHQLVERYGLEQSVREYYSDLTGEHIYERWAQEYEIACEIEADAVTFHLIDYFHIDGLWEFTNTRDTIINALGSITNHLLDTLEKKGLLKNGPVIELENAGFGLEYGVQTADDYVRIFEGAKDNYKKLRVGWDMNHLLHALGYDEEKQQAVFFITEKELNSTMITLQKQFGHNPELLAEEWVKLNILDERLINRVASIHVSDCKIRQKIIFVNGKLTKDLYQKMNKLTTDEKKEEFGVELVLRYFDSHLPLGTTLKNVKEIFEIPRISVVHELKNNELDEEILNKQLQALDKNL